MDYAALKAEIADPSYAGMTDQQIADSLNAKTVAVKVAVPSSTVRGTLYARGAWRNIVKAALGSLTNDATHDAALVAAKQLVDFCASGEAFHTDMPAILAQTETDLQALVSGGVITADDEAAVLALTDGTTKAFPDFINEFDIAKARALP